MENIIIEEKKDLSLKEKKIQQIQLKRAEKIKLTDEEKIFLKRLEIEELVKSSSQKEKKRKETWVKNISKVINPEILNFYDEKDTDLKLASLIIFSLENYKEVLKNVDLNKYVIKNEKTGKLLRIKKREAEK